MTPANYSEDAERTLIGAILRGSDMSAEILQAVPARSFYIARHQEIWGEASKIVAAGVRSDIVTLSDTLSRAGRLEAVGGSAYLMDLVDEHVSDARLDGCVKLVREYAVIRSAGAEASKIVAAVNAGDDAGEIVTAFVRAAGDLAIEAEGRRRRPESCAAVADEILTNTPPKCLKTGYAYIDEFTRISPENFIVIGARPGSGKSSLALGLALAASRAGNRVLFNCLEMSTVEMTESMMAHEAKIALDRIISRNLDQDEMHSCRQAIAAGANIVFSPQKTMPELIAKCRSMKANGGIDLVITDFIQKMNNPKSENRTQEVGSISRAHKELAMDFQIPVIALSQLSRAGDGVEPTLKDLRESGDLEQDANAVYFIWRTTNGPYRRGFRIAKDRRGAGTPALEIGFEGHFVRFDPDHYDQIAGGK